MSSQMLWCAVSSSFSFSGHHFLQQIVDSAFQELIFTSLDCSCLLIYGLEMVVFLFFGNGLKNGLRNVVVS